MGAITTDIRYAWRHYLRRPGVTLTTLLVLALGMAVATSLFSFLVAYAVEPAPGISRADDLVRIRGRLSTPEGVQSRRFAREELAAQAELTNVFARVAAWTDAIVAIGPAGTDPDWVEATFVTDGWFDVLGVRPAAGAGLPSSTQGDALVAVVSPALRERHFASDAEALGATIWVAGRSLTIVGIAPARFRGVDLLGDALQIWIPDAVREALAPSPNPPRYDALARLRPGVDLASASAAVQAIASNATTVPPDPRWPRATPATDVVALTASSGDPEFESEVANMSAAFTLLGLLVLLVTGTNASALQMGVAMTRGREIAMRSSLGATRARIVRQLLTESAMLGLAAGTFALALLVTLRYVADVALPDMPLVGRVDVRAAAFTFAVALATGVLAGLSPALHAAREGVASALKATAGGTSARRGRLQRGLVVAQVVATQPLVVMLTAMVLVLVAEYQRVSVDDVSRQVAVLEARAARADAGAIDATREVDRLARRLEALPGVARAIPDPRASYDAEAFSAPGASPRVAGFELDVQRVAPGWFDVMGRSIRLGRALAAGDVAPRDARGDRPVVVGEDLAAAFWPGQSPLGRRLEPPAESTQAPLVVVGVVETRQGGERTPGAPYVVYAPPPAEATKVALLLRMRGDPATALREVRRALHEAAPGLGVVELRTLAEVEGEARNQLLMGTSMLAALGVLTLLLAAIGLYTVVAHAVTQRIGEIAVRMAVGARAGQVVVRTMRDGTRLVALGLVAGLPLSLLGLRTVIENGGVLPTPVPVWQVGVIAMLGISTIAIVATWLPARRAARVQPASVLRGE